MQDTISLIAVRAFPLWMVALVVFLSPPLAAIAGWRFGRRSHQARGMKKPAPESAQGEATLNALLALLGLLLAFSFGFALSRADARRITQVEEATAISTAFLRADLLPEPGRSALREAIGDYARTRYSERRIGSSQEDLNAFLAKTLEAQSRLWPTAIAALTPETSPAIAAHVTNGITEVLDAHTRRLAAGIDGVPMIAKIMVLLYVVTALFLVGNQSGLQGRQLSWQVFALSFSLPSVMLLVVDFERPGEGFVRLDRTIMKITLSEVDTALVMK